MMDRDGANIAVVLEGADSGGLAKAAWSPDGAEIAFSGSPGGATEGIYIVGLDGANLRLVVSLEGHGRRPDVKWSPLPAPDGREKLAFTWTDVDPNAVPAAVYLVNPDGTGHQKLAGTELEYGNDLTWSPDASRLVVVDLFRADLILLDLALEPTSGEIVVAGRTNLAEVPGSPIAGQDWQTLTLQWPDWARTADRLALMANGDIWVLDLADPANPVLLGAGYKPTWSPDDAKLAFYHSAGQRRNQVRGIFVMNADGSDRVQISTETGTSRPDWMR